MKEGWEIKKLDDVCLIKGRIGYRGYTKQDLVNEGDGAISISPSNIKENKLFFDNCTYISWKKYDESPEIMVYEGDIIFCKTASIGKMAIVEYLPEKATLNPQFVVLKNIRCNNRFLFYFMNSEDFKGQFKSIIGGTAIPTLSQKNLGNLILSLPPLPEQQQIVSILDECFAAIDKAQANAEQNLKNSKELFESYLQGVFENGNWEFKELNQITEVKDGTHDSPKYIKEGIPFVTQKNIKPNGLTLEDTKFITVKDHDKFYKRSNVTFGDILISMIGANRGMSAIVDDKRVFSIKNVGLIKSSENMNMNFLLYYLKSPIAKKYVSDMSNGGAQEFVGLRAIRSFPIPFPPILKQHTIVSQLDTLRAETQKLEAIYKRKIFDLEELKKSVLNKAFSGELTEREVEI